MGGNNMSVQTFDEFKKPETKLYGDEHSDKENENKINDLCEIESVDESSSFDDSHGRNKVIRDLSQAIRSLLFYNIDMSNSVGSRNIINNLDVIHKCLTGLDELDNIYMVTYLVNIDSILRI